MPIEHDSRTVLRNSEIERSQIPDEAPQGEGWNQTKGQQQQHEDNAPPWSSSFNPARHV